MSLFNEKKLNLRIIWEVVVQNIHLILIVFDIVKINIVAHTRDAIRLLSRETFLNSNVVELNSSLVSRLLLSWISIQRRISCCLNRSG